MTSATRPICPATTAPLNGADTHDALPAAAPAIRNKDLGIETLRGIAIILMVMGHAIGSTGDRGLHIADDSTYRWFYDILAPLRMPLFTVISGYIYALRPVSRGSIGRFFTGKARRLLLPLFSVASLQYLAAYSVQGTVRLEDMWRIYFFSYDHFWFLQSIALIFLAVTLLELVAQLETARTWLLWLGVAACVFVLVPRQPWMEFLSIHGFRRLFVFFLLGLGLKRFSQQAFANRWIAFAIGGAAVGWAVQQLSWWGAMDRDGMAATTASLVIGVSGTYLLIRWRPTVKALAWIGAYAYTIYLFHSFGVSGARMVFERLGVHAVFLMIFALTTIGCTAAILGDWLLNRSPLARRTFLGKH